MVASLVGWSTTRGFNDRNTARKERETSPSKIETSRYICGNYSGRVAGAQIVPRSRITCRSLKGCFAVSNPPTAVFMPSWATGVVAVNYGNSKLCGRESPSGRFDPAVENGFLLCYHSRKQSQSPASSAGLVASDKPYKQHAKLVI